MPPVAHVPQPCAHPAPALCLLPVPARGFFAPRGVIHNLKQIKGWGSTRRVYLSVFRLLRRHCWFFFLTPGATLVPARGQPKYSQRRLSWSRVGTTRDAALCVAGVILNTSPPRWRVGFSQGGVAACQGRLQSTVCHGRSSPAADGRQKARVCSPQNSPQLEGP